MHALRRAHTAGCHPWPPNRASRKLSAVGPSISGLLPPATDTSMASMYECACSATNVALDKVAPVSVWHWVCD